MLVNMYRRLYSSKAYTTKSALRVVGALATKLSRTIIPDDSYEATLKNGASDLKANLQARKLSEQELFGMPIDQLSHGYFQYLDVEKELTSCSKENFKHVRQKLWSLEEEYLIPLLKVSCLL